MLCQNCKKREATVNHVETVGGKICAMHLCAHCADEMFGGFEQEVQNAVMNGLFGNPVREEKICPACGLSFSEYEESGLLGCPSCYDVFNEELLPYIKSIHGETVHVGKGGGVYTSEHDLRIKLKSLQEAMEDAILRGDFEQAGRINEQMNALKKRKKSGLAMVDYTLGTVISSRIRLARNINGYPFPARLKSDGQAKAIIRSVSSAVNKVDEFRLYYMDVISEDEALNLVENRLISPALLNRPSQSAALINEKGDISIMINEEDHLREQCISGGLSLRPAYARMSAKDSLIARAIPFAYDERLGYLTACPTNLGTGLRASVMMFLPALQLGGLMQQKLMGIIDDLGLTVRGAYGEGTKAKGYTFQISNEVTLGLTEEYILSQVEKAVGLIIKAEASERERLRSGKAAAEVKDKCLRAYGVLTNCALLTQEELDELCADVKLAACLGYLKINDISAIDELTLKMKPSNVNLLAGRKLSRREREEYCAQYASNRIKSLVSKA